MTLVQTETDFFRSAWCLPKCLGDKLPSAESSEITFPQEYYTPPILDLLSSLELKSAASWWYFSPLSKTLLFVLSIQCLDHSCTYGHGLTLVFKVTRRILILDLTDNYIVHEGILSAELHGQYEMNPFPGSILSAVSTHFPSYAGITTPLHFIYCVKKLEICPSRYKNFRKWDGTLFFVCMSLQAAYVLLGSNEFFHSTNTNFQSSKIRNFEELLPAVSRESIKTTSCLGWVQSLTARSTMGL